MGWNGAEPHQLEEMTQHASVRGECIAVQHGCHAICAAMRRPIQRTQGTAQLLPRAL